MAEIEGSLSMDAAAIPASGPYALRINRNDPYLVQADGPAAHRLPATRIPSMSEPDLMVMVMA